MSTHHLQQFAVYLLHLDCTQQSAARGGSGQMTQSCTNCLQGAGQRGDPAFITNGYHQPGEDSGHLCSTISRATQHFRFSFQECLSRATRIKRAGSMRPMQQWVGPCSPQLDKVRICCIPRSHDSASFLQPPGNQNPDG